VMSLKSYRLLSDKLISKRALGVFDIVAI